MMKTIAVLLLVSIFIGIIYGQICDPIGSYVEDDLCSLCRCYSGYFGPRCSSQVSGCNYIPYDNLFSKKEDSSAIDQTQTRFSNGNFIIVVSGGAVQLTSSTNRASIIGVGDRSLSSVLYSGFNNATLNERDDAICRCFTKTSIAGPTGICQDVWTFTQPWTDIRDTCCSVDNTDPFWIVYDCTLDVVHLERLSFPGSWANVTTRGRFNRFPLPLIIRFQKQINLTTNITVFADVEIKAYIAYQAYDRNTNRGQVQIDVSTLWPYKLSLNTFNYTQNNFLITYTFGDTPGAAFGCPNTQYSICWQTIFINIIPLNTTPPTCNLDNTFYFNFTVSCRTQRCPDLTTSQNPTSIIANIRTENFCPAVVFTFPINGTLNTFLGGFTVQTDNFIVYNFPITSNARKFCVRATINVDNNKVSQGTVGSVITGTYFKSLYLKFRGSSIGVYDDSFPLSSCPVPPNPNCGLSQIEIDTATSFNKFSLGANVAGACFYLTHNPTPPPMGLLDPLPVDWMEVPQEIEVDATIAVYYQNNKKSIQENGATVTLSAVINAQTENTDKSSASFQFILSFITLLFSLFVHIF